MKQKWRKGVIISYETKPTTICLFLRDVEPYSCDLHPTNINTTQIILNCIQTTELRGVFILSVSHWRATEISNKPRHMSRDSWLRRGTIETAYESESSTQSS